MKRDLDWEALAATWTEAGAPVGRVGPGDGIEDDLAALGRVLRRRRLSTAFVVALEGLLTIVLVFWTVHALRTELPDGPLLAGLWVSWFAATGFAWWNRRGQWRISVASTTEFLRLSAQRADRKVRIVWFTWALISVQGTFVGYLIRSRIPVDRRPEAFAVSALVVLGYLAWSIWYYRAALRERVHFRSSLQDSDG